MDISAIFKRAWEITWKFKGLWVLGILANCSGGGNQASSNFSRTTQYRTGPGEFPQLEHWIQSVPEEMWMAIAIAFVCLVLLLVLLFWALAVMGSGGLIAGFQMAETGEAVTLGSAFRRGIQFFWKLLGIQLLLGLATLILFVPLIIGIVSLAVATLGIGLICLAPLICLMIPLGIAISIYTLLAQIALIVEELDISAALKRAWEVLRTHVGNVTVMGLILGIGGFLVNTILGVPMVLLTLPLLAGFLRGTELSSVAGLTTTAIGILLYLPVLLLASGIVRTFVTGSWTLTYRSLTQTGTA